MKAITVEQWRQLRARAKHIGPRLPKGQNKTEMSYGQHLELRKAVGEIAAYWFEGVTLKLGDDLRYTADYLVQLPNGELELHEVKAGYFPKGEDMCKPLVRDDAMVKLRMAASSFPFRVVVCFRHSGWKYGNWQTTEI